VSPGSNRLTTQRSLLSGSTYALTNAAQRALAFILLPLYTAVLSSAEYGRLGLLLTLQTGAVVVLTAGMDNGVIRQYFQYDGDPAAQRRFVLTSWNFLIWSSIGLALVVAALLIAFAPSGPVFQPVQGALAVFAAATFVGATVVPETVLRVQQRLKDYMVLSAVAGIAMTVLALLFVVGLRLGVSGWIAASLIANSLTLVAGFIIIPWGRTNTIDRAGLRAALKLGLPLVPHAASGWSLQLADRIILATLVSVSSLGVYTLGANLSLPALVLLQGLNMGFLPSYARTHINPEAVRDLRNSISMQVMLTLVTGCSLSLLGPPFVSLLSSEYRGAGVLIPWIVLGYVFLGLYFIPMNVISMVIGRTSFVWTMTLTAAVANIVSIYILVPQSGILGAAEASAIGYFVLLVLVSLYARTFDIRASFDWRKIAPMTCVVITTFAVGAILLPSTGVSGLLARSALLITLPFTLALAVGVKLSYAMEQLRHFRARMGASS
jgi:O-antigen/teichoic acid export membrane protein